jgi:error-prone DNA polymerase
MPVLALTDSGGLYGAVKHAVACARENIAPALGADLALVNGVAGTDGGPRHLPRLRNETADRVTVLAVGRRGWASLCRLVSAAHAAPAGERGAPAVTRDLVAAHADGLIALVGPSSDVGRAVA